MFQTIADKIYESLHHENKKEKGNNDGGSWKKMSLTANISQVNK